MAQPGEHEGEILSRYCAGHITWREAAAALDIEGFAAFKALLQKAGLSLYEPDAKASKRRMAALDALLDEGL